MKEKTVRVGIFWVIDGKVYPYIERRVTDKLHEREMPSGKIDSDSEHFTTWDRELSQKYPFADFATFPRGRVMYDINENRHIIYADRCITAEQTAQIVALFQTVDAKICRDEHYRCDICIKKIKSKGDIK